MNVFNVELKDRDLKGTNSFISLSENILNLEYCEHLIAEVVKWQLAKARSGNACTKTRSEVKATTKKPFAQKETGRARQGSLVGPHFRGGGVAFGPHPRSYEYSLNKKIKMKALFSVLSKKFLEGDLHILSGLDLKISKTKDFLAWKNSLDLKSILFVGSFEESFLRSFANVEKCDYINPVGVNVLSCIKHETILFTVDSFKKFLSRYAVFSGVEFSLICGGEND